MPADRGWYCCCCRCCCCCCRRQIRCYDLNTKQHTMLRCMRLRWWRTTMFTVSISRFNDLLHINFYSRAQTPLFIFFFFIYVPSTGTIVFLLLLLYTRWSILSVVFLFLYTSPAIIQNFHYQKASLLWGILAVQHCDNKWRSVNFRGSTLPVILTRIHPLHQIDANLFLH